MKSSRWLERIRRSLCILEAELALVSTCKPKQPVAHPEHDYPPAAHYIALICLSD